MSSAIFLVAAFGTVKVMFSAIPPGSRATGVPMLMAAAIQGTTVLVVTRQLLAFAENASLLDRLDASLLRLGGQEQRQRSLLERSSDMTSIIDRAGNIGFVTPAISHLLGREPDAVLGAPALACLHPEARALQDQLWYQASHDTLTGLANRALFGERLAAADGVAAVLLIDLDEFRVHELTLCSPCGSPEDGYTRSPTRRQLSGNGIAPPLGPCTSGVDAWPAPTAGPIMATVGPESPRPRH